MTAVNASHRCIKKWQDGNMFHIANVEMKQVLKIQKRVFKNPKQMLLGQ